MAEIIRSWIHDHAVNSLQDSGAVGRFLDMGHDEPDETNPICIPFEFPDTPPSIEHWLYRSVDSPWIVETWINGEKPYPWIFEGEELSEVLAGFRVTMYGFVRAGEAAK